MVVHECTCVFQVCIHVYFNDDLHLFVTWFFVFIALYHTYNTGGKRQQYEHYWGDIQAFPNIIQDTPTPGPFAVTVTAAGCTLGSTRNEAHWQNTATTGTSYYIWQYQYSPCHHHLDHCNCRYEIGHLWTKWCYSYMPWSISYSCIVSYVSTFHVQVHICYSILVYMWSK